MSVEADKAAWRARLLAARAALSPAELSAAAHALRRHLVDRLTGVRRVAAYVPVGREPGSLDLLDALSVEGIDVLLPVVTDSGLDWSTYRGRDRLRPGPRATREPEGPRLGPSAVAHAAAVLVPALAVDHRGTRLGRGGGYFDRALAFVPAEVPVAALLHEGELVHRLPAHSWDRRVGAVVTPLAGWTGLPLLEHHGR